MCLNYDGQESRSYRKKWKKSGKKTRTFYKQVAVSPIGRGKYKIESWYFKNNSWKIGENISNRPSKKLTGTECKYKIVDKGIHTYLRDKKAYGCRVPLKVIANIDDFVGVNAYNDQAVFMKVKITKKARQDAIDYAISHGAVYAF